MSLSMSRGVSAMTSNSSDMFPYRGIADKGVDFVVLLEQTDGFSGDMLLSRVVALPVYSQNVFVQSVFFQIVFVFCFKFEFVDYLANLPIKSSNLSLFSFTGSDPLSPIGQNEADTNWKLSKNMDS